MKPTQKSRPYAVYVVEGEGEKAFWTKIGAAFAHEDGEGFNILMTAMPVNDTDDRDAGEWPDGHPQTEGRREGSGALSAVPFVVASNMKDSRDRILTHRPSD